MFGNIKFTILQYIVYFCYPALKILKLAEFALNCQFLWSSQVWHQQNCFEQSSWNSEFCWLQLIYSQLRSSSSLSIDVVKYCLWKSILNWRRFIRKIWLRLASCWALCDFLLLLDVEIAGFARKKKGCSHSELYNMSKSQISKQ